MTGIADAFDALGLRPGASPSEVRAAWRAYAVKFHPDISAHTTIKQFADLTTAYRRALSYAETEPCPECEGLTTTLVKPVRFSWGLAPVSTPCTACNATGLRWVKYGK